MPPKKRARLSSAAPSPATTAPSPKLVSSPPDAVLSTSPSSSDDPLTDPWTEEEETGLFRALILHKPTGIHKHMHMLSLHSWLVTRGYIHPSAPHTRIPNVWRKLRGLYDLETLDEREDGEGEAAIFGAEKQSDDESSEEEEEKDGEEDEDEKKDEGFFGREFRMPGDPELEALMWQARFPALPSTEESETKGRKAQKRRSSSPAAVPDLLPDRDVVPVRFSPSFDVEAESDSEESEEVEEEDIKGTKGRKRGGAASQASTRASTRGRGGAAARGRGRGRGNAAAARGKGGRRSSARIKDSVGTEGDDEDGEDQSVNDGEAASETSNENEKDADDGDGAGENRHESQEEASEKDDGTSEDEEDEEEEEESATPVPKATRGRGGARGQKGRPRGKKALRGRNK